MTKLTNSLPDEKGDLYLMMTYLMPSIPDDLSGKLSMHLMTYISVDICNNCAGLICTWWSVYHLRWRIRWPLYFLGYPAITTVPDDLSYSLSLTSICWWPLFMMTYLSGDLYVKWPIRWWPLRQMTCQVTSVSNKEWYELSPCWPIW